MIFLNQDNSTYKYQGVISSYQSVRTIFSVNGSPVELDSAEFNIYDAGGNIIDLTLLYPPRINYPSVGYVQVAFIPSESGITPGKYTFEFVGHPKNGGSPLTIRKEVELGEVDRIQWFIDELRTALLDKPSLNEVFPQRYLIRDPTILEWSDEELYSYLNRAVDDINRATPPTPDGFTLRNVPVVNIPILGGMLYALIARGIVEVYNYYDTNAPVRVNIYKGDKFSSWADKVRSDYENMVITWKKAWAIYGAKYRALVLTKLPFRVIRPISMLEGFYTLMP